MNHSRPSPPTRWKLLGVAVLAAVMTAGLVTWPWNSTEVPQVQAQETDGTTDGVADTEAEALTEAAASGEPVEVLTLRSEQREVFANPDGTFTANEYAAPVRTMVDGVWVDIDPTLETAADGMIVPRAATVRMAFSPGGNVPLVTIAKNGHVMTLDWDGDLPAPTLDGDTATYAEVLPDVDLLVTALDTGFTHTLVVKTAEAAADPALTSIEWPVTLDGAAVETTPEGGLAVVDVDTLDAWISADSPVMWDSSGVAEAAETVPYLAEADLSDPVVAADAASQFGQYAEVGISGSSSSIVLTPDQSLLTGADTVYPVYIDPVYRDESRTAWAMIASDYPNEEYWKWTGSQGVGSYNGGATKKRQLFRVPTSHYRGKDILSAEFAVTVAYNWYNDNHATGYDIYLDKVSSFSSSTNWNNKPGYSNITKADAPAATGGKCSSPTEGASTAMEWGITSTVQSAANSGTSTLSFQVRNWSETEDNRWIRICNNAQLRVKYNTPPDQPAMGDMRSSPGPVCQWGIDTESYVNTLPKLYVTATDADHGDTNQWGSSTGSKVSEQLQVQWQLTDSNNTVLYTSPLSSAKAAGSEFMLDLATASGMPTIASGTQIRWEARAYDGSSYSPWSSIGAPARCRFIYDATAPVAPALASTDFPEDDEISPMVGEIGQVTVSTSDTDIVAYKYDFNKDDEATRQIDLATTSADATIEFLPTVPGRQVLTVVALDAAGNSASNTYSFRVSVADPAGVWTLGDASGSTSAADDDGTNPGTPGTGVTFGANGPGTMTAALLDGTDDAYIDTDVYSVAPTGEGASIAAWARVDDLAEDGVIASIDGGIGEAGMTLGYRSTSFTSGEWILSMPDMAMGAFTSWEVAGGQVTATNADEWVHLVGVWNDYTDQMTLYINGVAVGSTERQTTWWGDGTVQIGRANIGGYWDGHFTGAIADVRVFDRVVPAGEAEALGWQLALRQSLWQFNTVGDDGSPEYNGGLPAALSGGASIFTGSTDPLGDPTIPLVGAGHLDLNGTDGHAYVASPVVDTSRSYTITARVRLDTVLPGESMTVLAIPGANASAIEVGYDAASGLWELRLAAADTTGASPVSVTSNVTPTDEAQGQSIAVVFDSTTGQVRLYVNGVPSAPLDQPFLANWTATGNLQIGRGFTDGSYGDYFAGAIDDVRAYSGVLHRSVIEAIHIGAAEERPEL